MIMQHHVNADQTKLKRVPWNKGKLIGAKPPLRPKHVWSIRTKLQIEGRTRDLTMFNLAIDSKLRGCDLVALKVEDIAPSGYAIHRATVRQRKTWQPVRFELTEQTRQAVDDYVSAVGKRPGEFMFTRRIFQYKIGSKQRRITFGTAPAISLAAARKTAGELHAKVRLG